MASFGRGSGFKRWVDSAESFTCFYTTKDTNFPTKKILKSFKNSKFTSKKSVFVKNGRLYNYISTDVYFSRCISLK